MKIRESFLSTFRAPRILPALYSAIIDVVFHPYIVTVKFESKLSNETVFWEQWTKTTNGDAENLARRHFKEEGLP